MSPSVFRILSLGEQKPTTVSLQFTDKSIKYLLGIIEDVLVKVDNFNFLVDFIMLDMKEDRNIPLILKRPFLDTGRTLIDVEKGELILRMQDEQVNFKMFKATPQPSNVEKCFKIDTNCWLKGPSL